MASLFDAAAQNPGTDGDVGVRWTFPFTTFATTANDTRAHLIANNELAGGVTPATFQDQGENDKRIDWFVLHHGNDFVILNLNSSMTNDSEVDFWVAFRESGTTNIWDYPISSDSSDSDPYEMPALQTALDAIVAVITGGGTLDAIIYDRSVASALDGWDVATLTYATTEELSMEATAGDPTAAFNLRAIASAPEELSMAARAGNPTAAFALRAIAQDVQRLSVEATAGDPTATFDLRAVAQDVQRLAMAAEAGNPTAAFNLLAIGPPMELSMEATAGDPTATFGNLRSVERRVRFSAGSNVGTNLDHHPDGMYTDPQVFWLGEIEIHEVAGGVVEIAIHRGGSAVNAADFFATWGSDWALYLVDETSREYVAIRARLIHSADQERIAWRSPTWQVVATNVDADDVPQWVLGVVGTLQVAIAPFDDYRPYS